MKILTRQFISICILTFLSGALTFAAETRPIKVAVDEEFVITLESNKTTGYEWQLAKPLDGNRLKFLKSEYTPNASGLSGAGGKEEWSFKAVNSGNTSVAFKYVRPWEKNVKPAKEKAFTVIINEGPKFTGQDYLKLSKRQRVKMVTSYIQAAKANGVTIKQSPVFYCKKLDSSYASRPDLSKEGLDHVLKTMIIMEYDWTEKGVDKEKLARDWLGEESYQSNKARLGKK